VSRLEIVPPLVDDPARDPAQSGLLGLAGLSKKWGPLTVLDDVSLDVHRGELISIEGANGAGKTTMLRIVVGMILPDAGSVTLHGLHPERNRREYLRRVGFLSAGDRALYPRLTTRKQLRFAAGIALIPKQDQEACVADVIDMFGLGKLADRRADRMSTGQRQRLRLAMSLVHRPSLVVLDEPTNSLDSEGLDILGAFLHDLCRRGGAAIWAAPAARMQAGLPSDRDFRLENGKLVHR
jgi:ABC-type multidrug transport system ATPase subunit